MPKNNIEVEIRSFIAKTKYLQLKQFFAKNAKFIKKDHQITYYLKSKYDLRLQINDFDAKIWLKKGNIHDEARKEIEVRFARNEFNKMKILCNTLGYKVYISWDRLRYKYLYQGVIVCLDFTKNYGYIIELEKMTTNKNKNHTLKVLKQIMIKLRLSITDKKIFEKKYQAYLDKYKKK